MPEKEKKTVIVTIGANPAWQKVLHFADFRRGEVNRADALTAFASGKGINFCRACRVWGRAESRLMQFAGGGSGKLLLADLDREGLKHQTFASDASTRCCTTCLGERDNSMTELIEPSRGPGRAAEEAALSWLEQALKQADGMAICGQPPDGMATDFYVECVKRAAAAEKPVLIDSWQKIAPVLENGRNITLKINAEELLQLTGLAEVFPAMRLLIEHYGLTRLAITDGAKQAFLAEGRTLWRFTVPRLDRVVNPVGSGDTASAVFWSELLCGGAPEEAFRAGLAAATANCLTMLCGSYDPLAARNFYQQITVVRQDLP